MSARLEAARAGNRFYTGRCKKHGEAAFYVSKGTCRACTLDRVKGREKAIRDAAKRAKGDARR